MPDLIAAAALAVAALLVMAFTSGAVRIVFGLLFLLFLPGYSLVSALFPGRHTLTVFERLVLSLASSFLLVSAGGMLLNLTRSGICPLSMSVFQLVLMSVLLPLAAIRRKRLAPRERFGAGLCGKAAVLKSFWANSGRCGKAVNLALAGSAALAVGALVFTAANPRQGEVFSEFYILGAGGMADGYVQEIRLGASGEVAVGIANHEQSAAAYDVKIFVEGRPAGEMGTVELEHGERHEATAYFTPQESGCRQKVELQLFKDCGLYHSLHIWIDVTDPEA